MPARSVVGENLTGRCDKQLLVGEFERVEAHAIILRIAENIFNHPRRAALSVVNLTIAEVNRVVAAALLFQADLGDKTVIIGAGQRHDHRLALHVKPGVIDFPLARQQIVIAHL